MAVCDHIENKGLPLDGSAHYAAILGECPSKGARSPLLWNAAFKAFGVKAVMHPMDVLAKNLPALIKELRADKRFIGGAVTMPHKVLVMPFLDELEPEAKAIGAVNCIYRHGEKLIGANTDGAGALATLKIAIPDLKGKKVLLIGTGGAGAAVAVYVAGALGTDGTLWLANRARVSRENLGQRIGKAGIVHQLETWPVPAEIMEKIDILINCTSIGFEGMKADDKGRFTLRFLTPLAKIPEIRSTAPEPEALSDYMYKSSAAIAENLNGAIRALALMKNALVFDIIYQPKTSALLYLAERAGLKTLNGLPMNLEQAVIAFGKANRAAGLWSGEDQKVRDVMSKV